MTSPATISLEQQLRAANRNLHLAYVGYFDASGLSADESHRRRAAHSAALPSTIRSLTLLMSRALMRTCRAGNNHGSREARQS